MDQHLEEHRYVRVQDALHNMHVSTSGSLLLECTSGATRNTIHFAINGIVQDHAYGRFNKHLDGSLKGKVVIIADPKEMSVPAGFNQVDTWFRLNAGKRVLDVGHATIIAPEGFDVPKGAKAVFYDGTLAARDAAVAKVLLEENVQQRRIGFRCWTDSSEGDAPGWARRTAKQWYPADAASIHIGMHDTSADARMDRIGVGHKVDQFRHSGVSTFVDDNGVSQCYLDDIKHTRLRHLEVLNQFLLNLSQKDEARCGPFYNQMRNDLNRDLDDAYQVAAVVSVKEQARYAMFDDIEATIRAIAPHRSVHTANGDGTGMEKLNPVELTERLMDKAIKPDVQIWIQGVSPTWEKITGSPLRDVFFKTACDGLVPLNEALAKNSNPATLGLLFNRMVQHNVERHIGSNVTLRKEALNRIETLGATIKSACAIDGERAALENVDVALQYAKNGLGAQHMPPELEIPVEMGM